VRSFLVATVAVTVSISGAAAQQQPCSPHTNIFGQFAVALSRSSPAAAAQQDFERAVCEYRNCLTANANNANACDGLRHIMDASAQAAGHYNGSR
jgi:hypothetical protein